MVSTPFTQIVLPIPPHLQAFNKQIAGASLRVDVLMEILINFGFKHIKNSGCGPFVAAIQEIETEEVLVVGANLVVFGNQGWAHGERVAIAAAQQMLKKFVLPPGYRMVTTAQMCIACLGETLASGLQQVYAACTGDDVEEYTPFKEGVLPANWQDNLAMQGCTYFPDLLRERGIELLRAYGKDGINYFNAGSSADES